MEKNISIGGKDVTLKASVFTQFTYKNVFGKDMTADLVRANELGEKSGRIEPLGESGTGFLLDDAIVRKADMLEISGDIDRIYLQILWTLAKEGDPAIPTFEKWLKSIEYIDMNEVMPAVIEVMSASMKVDRKNV